MIVMTKLLSLSIKVQRSFRTRLIVRLPVISVSEHLCRPMRESCGNCTHDTASASFRLWQAQCSLADLFFSRSKCPYLNIPKGLIDNTVPEKAKIKPAYCLPTSWKKCDANSGVKAQGIRRWPSIVLARVLNRLRCSHKCSRRRSRCQNRSAQDQ